MKTFHFSTDIHAPKETVWAVLWEDRTQRDWGNIIDEGMYIKGDLALGNEVSFLSGSGYGVTSLVEILTPNEFIRFRHKSDTIDYGRQEREQEWTGGTESYRLSQEGELTTLTISLDIPPEIVDIMKERLPEALARIKALAEVKA